MRRTAFLLVLASALALASTATASTRTQTYTAPGEHAFVVPVGVSSLRVVLVGANGGSGTGGAGGAGATFAATLAVKPGATLFTEVGGNGIDAQTGGKASPGGANGGGAGGPAVFLFAGGPGGGGGGGASDARTCSTSAATCPGGSSQATRLAVAAGGGGGGGLGSDAQSAGQILGGAGGSGGGPGGPGGPDAHGDLGGQPGSQGNQGSGGAAGGNSAGTPATVGQLGVGGDGGTAPSGGGGGGGGGLYGGGGAGAGTTTIVDPNTFLVATAGGAGGGGGSSGVPPSATGVSSAAVQQSKPGGATVIITWTAPAPAVSTAPAKSVTSSSAALAGAIHPNASQITDCHFVVVPAPPAGASIPCAQQVGGGAKSVPVSASATGLKAGTAYRYRLVASSANGATAGNQVGFTTALGGANPGPTPGGRPTLSGLKLTPSRFRAGRRAGTTIAFSLSKASRVTITFERTKPGGGFAKVSGKVRVNAAAGKRRVRFLGKVGGHRLRPGVYRVSAVASVAGRASAVRHARATVLR
jgi:hypothetical protein